MWRHLRRRAESASPPRPPVAKPRRSRGGFGRSTLVIALAGIAGAGIGFGLSQIADESSADGSLEDTADPSAAVSTATTAGRPGRLEDARARIISAVLNPSSTPSGQRRRRARVSVRVRVANRGESRGSVARPVLISGDARVKTDPNQDSSKTNIRSLGSGKARTVTLIFETAGEVTERLEKTERVRVIIAGRELNADLTIGSAVESDAATSEDASPGADTQP